MQMKHMLYIMIMHYEWVLVFEMESLDIIMGQRT